LARDSFQLDGPWIQKYADDNFGGKKVGKVDMDKMNTKGGSLAIGHPFERLIQIGDNCSPPSSARTAFSPDSRLPELDGGRFMRACVSSAIQNRGNDN
jgi:hypothetical protein